MRLKKYDIERKGKSVVYLRDIIALNITNRCVSRVESKVPMK